MARAERVERPTKHSEYEIKYGSTSSKRGWTDLRASIPGPLADARDFLTWTPLTETPLSYLLKGRLATISRDRTAYQRWQHKPTPNGGARTWFYVEGRTVHLEEAHTHHPNSTK